MRSQRGAAVGWQLRQNAGQLLLYRCGESRFFANGIHQPRQLIRRGGAIDLIMTALAGALGVSFGYLSHKIADVRVGGVPLNAAVGSVGVGLGAVGGGQVYDSSLSVRNFFFTGGAMFSVGSVAYALIHPEPTPPLTVPGLNLNPGGTQEQS